MMVKLNKIVLSKLHKNFELFDKSWIFLKTIFNKVLVPFVKKVFKQLNDAKLWIKRLHYLLLQKL